MSVKMLRGRAVRSDLLYRVAENEAASGRLSKASRRLREGLPEKAGACSGVVRAKTRDVIKSAGGRGLSSRSGGSFKKLARPKVNLMKLHSMGMSMRRGSREENSAVAMNTVGVGDQLWRRRTCRDERCNNGLGRQVSESSVARKTSLADVEVETCEKVSLRHESAEP